MEIQSKTTSDVWKSTLRYVYKNGKDFLDENNRTCREVLNLKSTVLNPIGDITKPITVLNSFRKWVYPPLEEISNIVLKRKLPTAYNYSYGSRIFNFNGVDQINQFLIPLLKNDANSRRGVIAVWDPNLDSNIHNRMVPGWMMIDFKLRSGRLCITSIVRSNDLWFGWPANLYQTFVLQNYVANKLNVGIGDLTTFSTSAHIFKDQFEYIKKILKMK